MHRRAAIRQAIVTALSGLPSAPGVTQSLVYPVVDPTLPHLAVVTGDEQTTPDQDAAGDGFSLQVRECIYTVEIRVSAELDIDDAIDALALEVETAIASDATIESLTDWFRYAGSEQTEVSGDVEVPVAVRSLAYLARYIVAIDDPQ